ncbi:ParB/RepB/Spo0J family partition protein [Bordetella sp. FB-8]|uniref:ParB/RepB/Spo0J family partition protein n=1 Tax=Bordetella sp. FB-8 TaxID=1159870 RepID=UPI00036EB150|nr:ParB/RepB/Spo0J family partition protein [Bordetella sp. FB-8]
MNTNSTEIAAIAAAAHRQDVSLAALHLATDYQARSRASDMTIEQLAATIDTVGLLNNLIAVDEGDGTYGICAGGRRLAALQHLHQTGKLDADYPVPVRIIAREHAHHASLIENVAREDMHTVDLIAAYERLRRDHNMSAEAIAAAHGATVLSVKKLLALANVAPDLLALFRSGDKNMTFEVLQALAGVDDHERQRAAWKACRTEYNPARSIRSILSESEMAATSPIARYLTVAGYEKAGGIVRRDLFAEGNQGVFLADPIQAETLAVEKMKRSKLAAAVSGEGWSWIHYQTRFTWDESRQYGQLKETARTPTKSEAAQLKKLNAARDAANEKLHAFQQDDDPEGDEDMLIEKLQELDDQIEAIENEMQEYNPQHKTVAGTIITLDDSGNLITKRGLIRREDRDAAQALMGTKSEKNSDHASAELPPAQTRPAHSQALTDRLHAQHALGVQAELAQRPRLGVCLYLVQLVEQVTDHISYLSREWEIFPMHASAARFGFHQADDQIDAAPAAQQLDTQLADLMKNLPKDPQALLDHLLAWTDDQIMALMGLLLALTMPASASKHDEICHVRNVQALTDTDMTHWWTPTAANYLGAVSKDQIAAVVTEAIDAETAAPLAKLKKGEAATTAEQLLAGRGWLPDFMRMPGKVKK